ncbi:peptide/nickel transport system ATP-binding protein [Kribbella aluminosa]|uniref:Peptide/nickel transport system ATP-binding protein n=1 Tax=Kribbella aluminosa TaxID=416017 RepID=A0ABS4UDC6_9ACTN|nr:ABC transporter ATP-binding protein [Kribbella aluminosa]MBP2349642.1 peptide/nickel transport system ATP-binding protein [Kribbella aluminosa]
MLEIHDLSVTIGPHRILGIEEFQILPGRRMGLVGESGSGKTMMATSIAGLLPADSVVRGSIRLDGRELVGMSDRQRAKVRGSEIGMIFQDPLKALNPVMRIGRQVAEAVRIRSGVARRDVRGRALELLEQVHLPDPEALARRYPHQLSGGQRQRALIAMAIARRPRLLVADEPTTALDVTVQKGILELLLELSRRHDMALLFITHDLGVVRAVSDRIAVMYGGQLVESGPVERVLRLPHHRYTEALVAASPTRRRLKESTALLGVPFTTIPGTVPARRGIPVRMHLPEPLHTRGRGVRVRACGNRRGRRSLVPVLESGDLWS